MYETLYCFPVRGNAKYPPLTPHGHLDAILGCGFLEHHPGCNIGFYPAKSGFVVMDIDPRNGGGDTMLELMHEHTWSPSTCVSATPSGGRHHFFRSRPGAKYPGRLGPGIDLKWQGYVLLPPSVVDGKPYEWLSKARVEVVPSWFEYEPPKPSKKSSGEFDSAMAGRMLAYIDPDCDYEVWCQVGMALHEGSGGSEPGLMLWALWSENGAKYRAGECERKWASFNGHGVTMGTLYYFASKGGFVDG